MYLGMICCWKVIKDLKTGRGLGDGSAGKGGCCIILKA